MSFLIFLTQGFIAVIIFNISDCFWLQWKDKGPNVYLKTIFDYFLAFLQVLQPIFSIWAIMAPNHVITSFQSLFEIGLITNVAINGTSTANLT